MKLTTVFKFILPVIVCFGIAGGGYYLVLLPKLDQINTGKPVAATLPDKLFGWKFPVAKFPLTGSNGSLIAYSSIRDPGGIPQGLPVRLKIPVIGVDSAIEDAYITPDGRMDVPAGSVNVAWFSLGPHPGQIGSAVIGGHFGITNGVPFVFYNLDKVQVGATVNIVDDNNNTLSFVVRSIRSFDRNADSTPVFTSSDGLAHLNLITCEGTWNAVNGNYPQRLVLFTDLVPGGGTVAVKGPSPIAVKPTLPSTALKVPTSTIMPSATPTAVPTIPPTIMPTEKIAVPKNTSNPFVSPQILIASAKSLYASPVDGIITSLLIISIVFISFKVIRH